MKLNEKWVLFLIATFVTFFGVADTLLKNTRAIESTSFHEEFEDENFYQCVVGSYNLEYDTNYRHTSYKLTDEELSDINKLKCSNIDGDEISKISSVKGIELLTSVEEIDLSYNGLENLDLSNLSNNSKLKWLDVSYNSLKSLIVDDLSGLKQLYAQGNKLENLDLSNNETLYVLDVGVNNLTELDLSNNQSIEKLVLSNNSLTSLDVSHLQKLHSLDVSYNNLSEIDTSKNNLLEEIDIRGNSFSEELYVYKGEEINLGNNVKIAEHFNWKSPSWELDENNNIVVIDSDGEIIANSIGDVIINGKANNYSTKSTIHVVEITSTEYEIDDEKIYVGTDTDEDIIRGKIEISNDDVNIDVSISDLSLLVKHGDSIIKTFELVTNEDSSTGGDKDDISILKGDVDGDGIVDKNDAFTIAKHIVKGNIIDSQYVSAADINSDGEITITDLVKLAKYIIKGTEL